MVGGGGVPSFRIITYAGANPCPRCSGAGRLLRAERRETRQEERQRGREKEGFGSFTATGAEEI